MREGSEVYVGLDTSKLKISVALAEAGRDGEVRFLGEIDSTPEAVERLVRKLAKRHGRMAFAYEAGPTGYGLQRQISALGHDCAVVAPSLIPRRPGERVSDCLARQAVRHGCRSRRMALRIVSSFRATATRATSFGLPASRRR